MAGYGNQPVWCTMSMYLLHNLVLLDPRQDELRDGMQVLVENGTVREVAARPRSEERRVGKEC